MFREKTLERQLNQQKLISSLAGNFIYEKNYENLINETLRTTGNFLDVNRIVVNTSENGSFIAKPAYYWLKNQGEFPRPDLTDFNSLIKNSFPPLNPGIDAVILFCNDIKTNEKYHCMKPAGITAFILAPLYVEGKFWGILSAECCDGPRIWNDSDRQLVSTIASVIAGATARKFRENERDESLKAAENASRAKTDFLSHMSHEMRTPMNAVIGMTAIAKNSNTMEKKDYCLNKIEEASTHLLGVINDILDMSKIEANKFELSPIEFRFERMLQKVVTVSSYRIDEKRQNLTVHIDKDVPMILIGDDQRLAQVITNLVSNAIKFTPDSGSIHLETRLTEQTDDSCTLKISVADSGIGITPEQKERLFSPFAQAESGTSRKFGGTGLGLAISKRIIEMMGGTIWVESEPEKGSIFIFTVTLQVGTYKKPTSLLNPGVDWNNIRILIVDDDKSVREYFSEIAKWFSLNCNTAAGATEALKLIEQNGTYDIYFIDWKMPGMDGLELAKLIKSRTQPETKSVVTIISSAELLIFEERAKQAGVDKFILKPLFPSSIADCINQCIGREIKELKKTETTAPDDFSGRRIILAEDIEINREIILSLLEPLGIEIKQAITGKEAVEIFTSDPLLYDMIFMDLQMPEMDGFEATSRIRAFEAEQRKLYLSEHLDNDTPKSAKHIPQLPGRPEGIPIIAMTANVFREDVEKCLAVGMNGHIGKPIDMETILAKLRKFLIPLGTR